MGKKTKEARCIDCECCGYESCEKMAFAIYNGFNKKENCIHFVKDTVEEEKKRALELADEIKTEKMQWRNSRRILKQRWRQSMTCLYHSMILWMIW